MAGNKYDINDFISKSDAAALAWKSRNIGRRTGKNILAGKTIRRDSKGFENFDDYFSDNDETSDSSPSPVKANKTPSTARRLKSRSKNVSIPATSKSQSPVKKSANETSLCETPRNQSFLSASRRLLTPSQTNEADDGKDECVENNADVLHGSESSNSLKRSFSSEEDLNSELETTPSKKNKSSFEDAEPDININLIAKGATPDGFVSPEFKSHMKDMEKQNSKISAKIILADLSDSEDEILCISTKDMSKILENSKRVPFQEKQIVNDEISECSDEEFDNEMNVTDVDCSGIRTPAVSKKFSKLSKKKKPTNVGENDSFVKTSKPVKSNSDKKITQMKKQKNKKDISSTPSHKVKNNKISTKKKTSVRNATKHETNSAPKAAPIYPTAENPELEDDSSVRRSKRTRLPPLQHWKQERPVYKRTSSGFAIVGVQSPLVKTITRKTKPAVSKRKKKAECKTELFPKDDDDDDKEDEFNPQTYCGTMIVNQSTGKEEVETCVGVSDLSLYGSDGETSSSSNPFSVAKIYSCHSFTCGILYLKGLAEKPNSINEEYTVIYSIIKGRLEVNIHRTKYILKTGAIFVVPKGNSYSIRNTQKGKASLHYTCNTGTDYSFTN